MTPRRGDIAYVAVKGPYTTKPRPVVIVRDLFAELSEGMIALVEERQGKRVPRSHSAEHQAKRKLERSKSVA